MAALYIQSGAAGFRLRQGLSGSVRTVNSGRCTRTVSPPRVLERFVRLSPGDGKGSGLGLSIVGEIAALHGGRVELADTPGGGLTVRVHLPLFTARTEPLSP